MARGANQNSQPYIVISDRVQPDDKQTRFWLKVKNSSTADEVARRYAKARREGVQGEADFDLVAMAKARQFEWMAICDKVENYAWSESYLDDHPQIQPSCSEDGFYDRSITPDEANLFLDVLSDLPIEVRNELFDAADSRTKLEVGHPKNVNLPSR